MYLKKKRKKQIRCVRFHRFPPISILAEHSLEKLSRLTVVILMYSKRSVRKCGNPFSPWQCPYPLGKKRIILEKQVGVKSPPRKKRIGGGKRGNEGLQLRLWPALDNMLCVDLSSLRVSPSLRVVIFTRSPGRALLFSSLIQ